MLLIVRPILDWPSVKAATAKETCVMYSYRLDLNRMAGFKFCVQCTLASYVLPFMRILYKPSVPGWLWKEKQLLSFQGLISKLFNMFSHLLNLGGDFPRATQPGKLFSATGLEITFAVLSLGIMLGSLALPLIGIYGPKPRVDRG